LRASGRGEGGPYRDGSCRAAARIDAVAGRKHVEEAMKEGEARFRMAFEQSAVGIAISDLGGKLLETNRAYQELVGYTGEELCGKDASALLHPDEATGREILAVGLDLHEQEKPLVRKDGRVVWVGLTTTLVRNDAGEPLFLVEVARDVSERKRAEAELRRNEERFYRFVEHAADAFFVHDLSGRIVEVNQRACDSLGYTRGELLELSVYDIEQTLTLGGMVKMWEEMVPGLPLTVDGVHRRKDGTTFPVELRLGSFASEGRELVLALARDVTDRKRAEEKLRESEGRFRQLFEQSVDALFVHDEEGRVVDCNSEACRSLGYEREELLALSVKDFVVDLLTEEEREALGENTSWSRAMSGEPGKTVSFHQNRHRRKNGTTFPVEVGIGSMEYGGRRLIFASARDITERKELEGRLAYQAFHDPLTGLPNRALFLDRLGHALDAAGRSEDSVALLFLDLDNFKVVNDSLGHGAGDELLVAVGSRLQGCVRPGDTVARLGGDEFTVLLERIPGTGEAERVVERIMDALAVPFEVSGSEVVVTASVGVVPDARRRGRGPADLLREADLAMYRAKESGKASYAVYEEAMSVRAAARLGVERDLRLALADPDGAFEVYYQPKVALASGEVVGMEALVQWRHPERGLVLPGEFISVAEETGLILRIGRFVLSEACRSLARWRDARPPGAYPLLLCVNVSARQLKAPGFVEEVAGILDAYGLEPDALVLEITESVVMDEPERSSEKLGELKALGVRLAIDDFGTGYSSLSYLRSFPVDYLKIDRSFLNGLGKVLEDTVLVSGVLGLARSLGLAVVAEGIETSSQLAQLRELGCELGQGFYFSEPLPEGEATALLVHGGSEPFA
jgi:diguanylate cyclase (GGDEF)-like protein/PAS domain S-box-containing protein